MNLFLHNVLSVLLSASGFVRDAIRDINTYVPADIKFLLVIICIFTTGSVTFFVWMLTSRTYQGFREKKAMTLRKKFELLITAIIFEEDWLKYENVRQRQKLINHYTKNYLRKKFNRQILIEEIINLYKDLAGKPAENLRQLFMSLGLESESFKKLKSKRWHIRAKGISELSKMNIKGGYVELYKLINSSNNVLREEAQLALVKLFNFDALSFLDDSKYPISEWQQINILAVLTNMSGKEIPDFSHWLTSKNESVVIFALKLISHFSCLDLTKEVTRTLNHPSPRVRKAVVDTLGDLDAASALSLLKKRFYTYEKDFKLEVLKVSGKIAIEKDYPFLELQLLSDDYDISTASATALAAKGDSGKKMLEDIYSTYADDKLKGIIKNVIEELN